MKYCYINKDSEKHIYTDFIRDLQEDVAIPTLHFANEYEGQEVVKLCCTQYSKVVDLKETIGDYERKKISSEWVKLLSYTSLPLKEVQLCTVTPQNIFDALCNQINIESLRVKHFTGKNISSISRLHNLKKLFIESAPSITDISPIAELENLEILILGSTVKVTDYSSLGKLHNLKVFSVCSYIAKNDVMKMDDDSFIREMKNLKYLELSDVKINNQKFLTEENAKSFEYACFPIGE